MSYAQPTTEHENRTQALRTLAIPKKKPALNSYDLEEIADRAANSTIEGFLQQDKHDFDASSLQFSIMLQTMFPEYDSERLLKASQAYVSALLVQSRLKDEHPDSSMRLHDERWEYVRNELVRMSKLLDMPSSFGVETEEFWRYHAGRDDSFVKHIIEFHRALVPRLTGDEKYFKALAGLYFAGLAFHDEHTPFSVIMGREVMRLYYRILFQLVKSQDEP